MQGKLSYFSTLSIFTLFSATASAGLLTPEPAYLKVKPREVGSIKGGMLLGMNYNSIDDYGSSGYENVTLEANKGVVVGGLLNIAVHEKVLVQTEVAYSSKGFTLLYQDPNGLEAEDAAFDLYYLELSAPIIYRINDSFSVNAGSYFSIPMGGSISSVYVDPNGNVYRGNEEIDEAHMDTFETGNGLLAGASYYFSHNFLLTGRYTYDFKTVYKGAEKGYYQNIQFMFAFEF